MKTILLVLSLLLASCSTPPGNIPEREVPSIPLGEEVRPPIGCIELRIRTGDPEAC